MPDRWRHWYSIWYENICSIKIDVNFWLTPAILPEWHSFGFTKGSITFRHPPSNATRTPQAIPGLRRTCSFWHQDRIIHRKKIESVIQEKREIDCQTADNALQTLIGYFWKKREMKIGCWPWCTTNLLAYWAIVRSRQPILSVECWSLNIECWIYVHA